MENFVLNLFSEHLSKVILNFNDEKMKINANFLAGRGSITNIRLNVEVINNFLMKPPHGMFPYLQFTDITLTELRIEVTSYTNLKKAPVVLVIDEIDARAMEPLEYYFGTNNDNVSSNESARNAGLALKNSNQPKQHYGLLHRIQDNMSVRVNKINLTFETLGKFKTRRVGPWTPPPLLFCLKNVEWISVTEHGNPDTPERIWAHNDSIAQQFRSRTGQGTDSSGYHHRSYVIYKRLSMNCEVKLSDMVECKQSQNQKNTLSKNEECTSDSPSSIHYSQSHRSQTDGKASILISSCNIDIHVAYLRRIRDASITGVDVDILCHDVDVCLNNTTQSAAFSRSVGANSNLTNECDLRSLIHLMAGLQHCLFKDRSFVDPLLADQGPNVIDCVKALPEQSEITTSDRSESIECNLGKEGCGSDSCAQIISIEDDNLNESSDVEEESDENSDVSSFSGKREHELEGSSSHKMTHSENIDLVAQSLSGRNSAQTLSESSVENVQNVGGSQDQSFKLHHSPSKYVQKRKAVSLLVIGAQKYERLSFSFTLSSVNLKLYLPQDYKQCESSEGKGDVPIYRHCFELLLEGFVFECIWPKPSGEIGGQIQCFLRYLHILESVHHCFGTFSELMNDQMLKRKCSKSVKYIPLLRIGSKLFQGHDIFSLSSRWREFYSDVHPVRESDIDDGFPMIEARQAMWKWDRSARGPHALVLKSSLSFLNEKLVLWSKTKVIHEASIGKIEVVLESELLERLEKLVASSPWDDRWFSGDWSAEIHTSMISFNNTILSGEILSFKHHVQPLPTWCQSNARVLSTLSSDLRSVTARFEQIIVRVPHPAFSFTTYGLSDVVCSVANATLLITSGLPATFLTGEITACGGSSQNFPNDMDDLSCRTESDSSGLNEKPSSTFRMQISVSDFSLELMPIEHSVSLLDDARIKKLIHSPKVTFMLNLEHDCITSHNTSSNSLHISQTLMLSVLLYQLECNFEIKSIISALDTVKYHLKPSSRCPKSRSYENDYFTLSTAQQTSATTEMSPILTNMVVCIHIPHFEFDVYVEQVGSSSTAEPTSRCLLIVSRLTVKLIEFGIEAVDQGANDGEKKRIEVYKGSIGSVSIQLISKKNSLVEIASLGNGKRDFSWLNEIFTKRNVNNQDIMPKSTSSILFRADQHWNLPSQSAEQLQSSALTVDFVVPLIISIDVDDIKICCDLLLDSFSVMVHSCAKSLISYNQQCQVETNMQSTCEVLCSSIFELLEWFDVSSAIHMEEPHVRKKETDNTVTRVLLSELIIYVPFTVSSVNIHSFVLRVHDIEVAFGQLAPSGLNVSNNLSKKQCGRGETWYSFFLLNSAQSFKENDTKVFYVLRLKQSLHNIEQTISGVIHKYNSIAPSFEIDWCSKNNSFGGAFTSRDFMEFIRKVGASLSTLSMILMHVSSSCRSSRPDVPLSIRKLHEAVACYHSIIHRFIIRIVSEVNTLRLALFEKERERVGMMAVGELCKFVFFLLNRMIKRIPFILVSSSASGWLRVSTSLPFPHRIFGTATFFRYWVVLNSSLIILYNDPACRFPSLIFPLDVSISLCSISVSSSSNANRIGPGIVGKHLEQRGFALVSSTGGNVLYFVTSNHDEYSKWVTAISYVLDNPRATGTDEAKVNSETGGLIAVKRQHDKAFQKYKMEKPLTSSKTNSDKSSLNSVIDYDNAEMFGTPLSETQSNHDEKIVDRSVHDEHIDYLAPTNDDIKQLDKQFQAENNVYSAHNLVKGKSRFVTTKLSSVLKTAKSGVLAAGEIGRDGIRQALSNEGHHSFSSAKQKEEMLENIAGVDLMGGKKHSVPKINASAKLSKLSAVVRSSMQEHYMDTKISDVTPCSINLQNESVAEQTTAIKNEAESISFSLSREDNPSQACGRKDLIRQKFTNFDQSMTNTMRRLKIEDKLNSISAAVKSAANESHTMMQLNSTGSFSSKNMVNGTSKIDGRDETLSLKPIKFDARETFSSQSEYPVKVKSIKLDEPLRLNSTDFSERSWALQKFEGKWLIQVQPHVVQKDVCFQKVNTDRTTASTVTHQSEESSIHNQECYCWNYKITSTVLGSTTNASQISIMRSLSEILIFHALISEILMDYYSYAAKVTDLEARCSDSLQNLEFFNLSSLESVRVSGLLLNGILDESRLLVNTSPSVRDSHCKLIKIFIDTLITSSLPSEAVLATEKFLNIDHHLAESVSENDTFVEQKHTSLTCFMNNTFDSVFRCVGDLEEQPSSSFKHDLSTSESMYKSGFLSLLTTMMARYEKAIKERDEALASLAAASMMQNKYNAQKQEKRCVDYTSASLPFVSQHSSEDEMKMLCQHLGSEIAARTEAELEINRLKEKLKFEKELAEARECDLLTEVKRLTRNWKGHKSR